MRRRVMTIYVGLLVLAVIGLSIPLAGALAAQATAAVAADRTADAARFAGLAERSVVTGSAGAMTDELSIYEDLFGVEALVLDREGGIIAASRSGLTLESIRGVTHSDESVLPPEIGYALAGTRPVNIDTVWPWSGDPLLIAEPVVSGGEVVGVVLTASPTDSLRVAISLQWALALALVIVVLAAGIAAAGPLARWVLRPIAELEEATTVISEGDLMARVPRGTGPPELRHLGRSFNRMAAKLHRLVSRQRTFVAFAGHQVRNPLAALRLRVEALGGYLDAEASEDLALTIEEVDRLTRTCDALITLARADAGGPPLVVSDVADTIRRRVRGWLPIAERSGVDLRYAELPEDVQVRVFDGTVDQVLDALIDNALKFGGNSVEISASTRVYDEREYVEIEVRDNGPGLSTEELEHAVEPFWRSPQRISDPARPAAGGTGLGLSVVVTLVGMQGGRLTLRQAKPHGVEAVLRLPISGAASPRDSSELLPDAARPAS